MTDKKNPTKKVEPSKPSRYQRVVRILDAAAKGSSADYEGHPDFWRLPLAQLLEVEIEGIRMIAPSDPEAARRAPVAAASRPPRPAGEEATPRSIAESPKPAASGCCGTTSEAATEAPPPAAATTPAAGREPGRGARSGLILGLRGEYPFDHSQFPPLMWGGERVAPADIQLIEDWIDDGCPTDEEPAGASASPPIRVTEPDGAQRAMGDKEHPPHDGPVNQHRDEIGGRRVRKNINCMTDTELTLFRSAIAEMHRWNDHPNDQRSWIHWAQIHANNCQHAWEQFLPWHRAYLYEFEHQLMDWDPIVALPYWQWSEYYDQNSEIFAKTFGQGGAGPIDQGIIPPAYGCWVDAGALTALAKEKLPDGYLDKLKSIEWDPKQPDRNVYLSGSRLFARAEIQYGEAPEADDLIMAELAKTNPLFHRQRWPGGDANLLFENYPSPDDIDRILEIDDFFKFASGPDSDHFFGALENVHNVQHNFSGGINPHWREGMDPNSIVEPEYGDMVSGARTAYDPIFWGHHSNVDRLWFEWQQKHPGLFADDPAEGLPPWNWKVEQMRSVTKLGYEYARASYHYPTDSSSGMTLFRSARAGIQGHTLDLHRRAEVRLHNIHYREKSGALRVYLNDPEADASTSTRDNPHFVGELHLLFGQCVGGPGHCDPPGPRRPNDQRSRHRKTPRNARFDATKTVEALLAQGATDFTVQVVTLDARGRPSDEVLKLDSVSLDFFD